MVISVFLPAFQLRKLLLHHRNSFFFSNFLLRVFIEFFYKLGTMFYHFLHGAVLREFTLLIAVSTIICTEATVSICSSYFIGCERHSATLAKFHFHNLFELEFVQIYILILIAAIFSVNLHSTGAQFRTFRYRIQPNY